MQGERVHGTGAFRSRCRKPYEKSLRKTTAGDIDGQGPFFGTKGVMSGPGILEKHRLTGIVPHSRRSSHIVSTTEIGPKRDEHTGGLDGSCEAHMRRFATLLKPG